MPQPVVAGHEGDVLLQVNVAIPGESVIVPASHFVTADRTAMAGKAGPMRARR